MLSPLEGYGIAHYAGHRSPVTALAFDPSGSFLVSGDVDRRVCLWKDGSLKWGQTLRGGQKGTKARAALRMRSLAFSPSGKSLFAAGSEQLEAISTRDGAYEWSYQSPRAWGFLITLPMSVAVSEWGLVAASFDNATMGIWDEAGQVRAWFRGNDIPDRVGFLPGGRFLVGMSAFRLSLFDVEEARRVSYFESRNRFVSLAVHPVLPFVACRSLESVFVFDPFSGEVVGGFDAGYGLPLLSFKPNAPALAVTDLEQVQVKDFAGATLQSFNLMGRRCTSLAWDFSGERLAIGCSDGDLVTVRVA